MQGRKTAIVVLILESTALLKHDIEGHIEGGIEVTVRRKRIRKQLQDDLMEKKGY
jgi:hypothetical protein